MTAHNHGYDPTCKETRLPDGKAVGECMTDTTNTPTPSKGDMSEQNVKRYDFNYDGTADCCCSIDESHRGSFVDYTEYALMESRALSAEAELAALRSAPAPDAVVEALLVMRDNARTATEKNMAEQALATLTKGEEV